MSEREDPLLDTEGDLSQPGEPAPDTDEFGRDDPVSLERDRRRRQRETRRTRSQPAEAAPRPGEPMPRAVSGGRFRRRRIVAIVTVVVGLLFAWFLVALFQPFAGDGQGTGYVPVMIPKGASASTVSDILDRKGVVTSSTLMEIRLRLSGKGDDIVSGLVPMAKGMSYGAAIDRITGEATTPGTLVLPEGYSRDQTAPLVEKAGVSGNYMAASKRVKGFDPSRYGAPKHPSNLEGFLFPATYDVHPGETVDELVAQQLQAFRQNLSQVNLEYAKKRGNLTPYDVVTIASMIDREVVIPKERRVVAAVIWNRLRRGEPLAIDATTRYEFRNYTHPITESELEANSPYNTRTHVGLPPTPIGNPGLASIEAAAHPAHVDYLFYVVNPNSCGGHSFTSNLAEFNKLVKRYNTARAANGGNAPSNC